MDFELEIQSQRRGNGKNPSVQYNEPTVRAWFLSIGLTRRPRCPGCGGHLLPKVTTIALDIAWCESCGRRAAEIKRNGDRPLVDYVRGFASTETHRIVPYLMALTDLASPIELTQRHGVTFWTPPLELEETDAYLRWLTLHQELTETATSVVDYEDDSDRHSLQNEGTPLVLPGRGTVHPAPAGPDKQQRPHPVGEGAREARAVATGPTQRRE